MILPRKQAFCFEDSRTVSQNHLANLTTKLLRNNKLIRECDATVREYAGSRMAELAFEAVAKKCLYPMSHQTVMRESSTTRKLFDAS